jgi:hypothetical protein
MSRQMDLYDHMRHEIISERLFLIVWQRELKSAIDYNILRKVLRVHIHIHLITLSLSLFGSTALWSWAAFFSFLILYTDGRTTWTSDQLVAKPIPAHRTTTQNRINAHRHPCFEWDSNTRLQCSSGRTGGTW